MLDVHVRLVDASRLKDLELRISHIEVTEERDGVTYDLQSAEDEKHYDLRGDGARCHDLVCVHFD